MPELDLSDALTNTDFVDGSLWVWRRTETVDPSTGFAEIATVKFGPVYATVCAADQNSLDAGSDESHQDKAISVITRFPLRGVSPGTQSDLVLWRGDKFKVVKIEDYSHFGPGFVQAVCHSIDAADTGPETLAANTGLLGAL